MHEHSEKFKGLINDAIDKSAEIVARGSFGPIGGDANTEVLRKMGKHTGISSECAVPTDSRDSILIQKQKSINAQVVIGTPGTIKKWISFKKLNLTRLTILVFDEADQMHAEVLLLSATFNDIVKNFVERTYKVHCPDELSKIEIYQFNGANSIKIYGYDVFILDSQNKIYQFNRANSNIQERAKALEVIQYLKKKYHEGKCNVAIVDDGKLDTESDSDEFWVLFGGFAPIGKKVVSDEDIIPETTPAQLFRFYQQMLVLGIHKGILIRTKYLDCGTEVSIWVGRVTQVEEQKAVNEIQPKVGSPNKRVQVQSQDRLNGLNQGGPRQRAEALAALNSAFKSSSGTKSSSPKTTGRSQGSPAPLPPSMSSDEDYDDDEDEDDTEDYS
ncbi:hypothetical protein Ahy_B01g054831 isoform A [Arachis hypogaea]|uniref:Helicase ATP-binding domain-containing protein n=1 Tax=Arachis hypogaea TaxID=3818 RepID=A0A445AUG0_ARAHY|nr:hypothetical protein Ahy_B01g054831 isoform A [Arachis hypogaea]